MIENNLNLVDIMKTCNIVIDDIDATKQQHCYENDNGTVCVSVYGKEYQVNYAIAFDKKRNITYYIASQDYSVFASEMALTMSQKIIELDVVDDYLEKSSAILSGIDYDERVIIAVELTDELKELCKAAQITDISAFMQSVIDDLHAQHLSVEL